jgi:purine-nucleoside phosphorylase
LYDVILAKKAWSESTFARVQGISKAKTLSSSPELNKKLLKAAKKLKISVTSGTIHSSDVFYRERFEDYIDIYQNHKCIAVEMESYALYANAMATGKKAACLLTVSDSLVTHEATTAKERQEAFDKMMLIALELAE